MLSVISQKHLRIDAIIHNASTWASEKGTDDYLSLINNMMQVHVNAPYLINLTLAPQLGIAGTADIIHITDYVVEKGSKKHVAYAASKAALANMTLSFAQQFAPSIKVNSIAPALVCFNEWDNEEYKQKALNKSLMRREAGKMEVLDAIKYIMKSQYMTGQTISLDGGRALI